MAFARIGFTRPAAPNETAVCPGHSPIRKLMSELLSNRLPMAATTTKEGRNELEIWWARLGSNQRPADYESAALTS
jgi:hypothetical protein